MRRHGDRENRLLAMKVLQKWRLSTHNLKRYAMTERNVMSALDHPFMVRLVYAFQSPSRLFLVMDYYSGATSVGPYIVAETSHNRTLESTFER